MTKWEFTNHLKNLGYAVDENASYPTVLLVGASKNETKQKFYEIKLIAQKVGYKHTLSVKNLEEENHD